MRRLLALCLMVLVMVACKPEAPSGTDQPDCAGGQIVQSMSGPVCAMPNADAGKACARAGDCSGVCLAETRTCSPYSPQFGCFELLDEGGQMVGLCVD